MSLVVGADPFPSMPSIVATAPFPFDLISFALGNLNGNYNLVAVVTILACDILSTFDDERKYIWKKQFGITSLLYMVTRHLPFLTNVALLVFTSILLPPDGISGLDITGSETPRAISLLYCIPWFVVLACTEYLFIMRAVALNGNSRLLYYALLVLFIGEMVCGLVLYLKSLPHPTGIAQFIFVPQPNIGGTGKIIQVISFFSQFPSIFTFGVPELLFQSTLALVIIITVIKHRKTWILSEQIISLTTIIVRDGLWGYFFNICGLLVIIIRPRWLEAPAGQAGIQWSYVTFSMTCSRLLLNIRSVGETPGVSAMTSFPFSFNLNSKSQTDTEIGSNFGPQDTP